MQKKNKKISPRGRQKQKLNRKIVLVIAATGIACLGIVLTIIISTSRIDKSMAAESIYLVPEQVPVVEKTLDAPVIIDQPHIGPNTILVRALKTEHNPAPESHN